MVIAGALGWFLGRRRTRCHNKAVPIRNRRISDVIESSERLIDDLATARYRLQQQSQELDRTRWEARTDPLSGLANRRAFDEAFESQVVELRQARTPFGLLLIDVDHFKQINDNHGHQIGDQLIAQLGRAIRGQVRSRDFVARFGGDEFTILFSGLSQHNAFDVARRIQVAIQHSGFDCLEGAGELELNVTLSMGLATSKPDDTTDSVLRRSDDALYRAKRNGRNQLVVWRADIADLTPEGSGSTQNATASN